MKSAFLSCAITTAKIASQYRQLHLYRKHLFINKQLKCLIVIFYIFIIITFAVFLRGRARERERDLYTYFEEIMNKRTSVKSAAKLDCVERSPNSDRNMF